MISNIDLNFFQNNKFKNIVYVQNKLDGYSKGQIIDITSEHLVVDLFPNSLNPRIQTVSCLFYSFINQKYVIFYFFFILLLFFLIRIK